MYRKDDPNQMEFQNFYLPFGGELDDENRWVILADINEWIVAEAMAQNSDVAVERSKPESPSDAPHDSDDNDLPPNNGKMIVDATCTPADISYPTDLKRLNEAREKAEDIIDALHAPDMEKKCQPRTYLRMARTSYLDVAKQKKPGYKKIRRAIDSHLHLIHRHESGEDSLYSVLFFGLLLPSLPPGSMW